jgi:hypothetical protein
MKPQRIVKVAAFLFAALALGMHPASAQVPTPPPLPPLPIVTPPPAAQPVLEFIAPTVYPPCGTAALVVFLAGSSAPSLAPDLNGATTPVFAICGSVPRPPQQFNCLLDTQAQEAVSTVTGQVGVPLPLGLHPQGDVVEQTILVVDKLPPPAKNAGVQTILPRLLVCAAITQSTQPQGDYSLGAPITYPPGPFVSGPYSPGTIPGFPAPPPAAQAPFSIGGPVPQANPVGDAVIYAGIWLVPLALLFFGGYFGGALTRDITISPPSASA